MPSVITLIRVLGEVRSVKRTWYPISSPSDVLVSAASRSATERAAIRRGWVWPTIPPRPPAPRPSSRQILGSWVVFPEPVSPATTTWWSRMAAAMSSRRWLIGSSGGKEMSTTRVILHQAAASLPPSYRRVAGDRAARALWSAHGRLTERRLALLTRRSLSGLEPAREPAGAAAAEAVVAATRVLAEQEAAEATDDEGRQRDRDDGTHVEHAVEEALLRRSGVRGRDGVVHVVRSSRRRLRGRWRGWLGLAGARLVGVAHGAHRARSRCGDAVQRLGERRDTRTAGPQETHSRCGHTGGHGAHPRRRIAPPRAGRRR